MTTPTTTSLPSDRKVSPFLEDYRSAVALNNVGISLLERRCYREAAQIFRDALETLPNMKVKPFSREKSLRRLSQSEVEHKLYCATLHLACESDDGEPPVLVQCCLDESDSDFEDEGCSGSFSVLNQHGDDLNFSHNDSRLKRSLKPHIFYLSEQSDKVIQRQDVLLAFALLLHNQGQAHRYVANLEHAHSKARADTLREASVKLFHLSRSALEELDEPASPIVTAAFHQTKLEVERGLGMASARTSFVELADYSVPIAAVRKESPSVSLSSLRDDDFEKILLAMESS
jgi:hypothetical protein